MFQYISIIITATAGFILAFYIWNKKKRGEKLFCLLGEDCDKIVTSRYSTTLGIPNEVIGMLYYGSIVAMFILSMLGLVRFTVWWFTPVIGAAALFSVYLVSVQLFVIKEWCEWCLGSAAISVIIFILIFI